MTGLLEGEGVCDLCGETGRCFDLRRALKAESLAPAKLGCLLCLQRGRFGFFHITEVGYLDECGLTWYGEPPIAPSRIFVASSEGLHEEALEERALVENLPTDEAVDELRRTPDFPTWNEVSWRVHCRDFMVFLGSWQPSDIVNEAKQRGLAPEALFADMVDLSERRYWQGDGDWGINFVVFRCDRCQRLVGVFDLD